MLRSDQFVMYGRGRFALPGRMPRAGFPLMAATLFPSERGYFVFEKRWLGKHDSIYLITITQ